MLLQILPYLMNFILFTLITLFPSFEIPFLYSSL
nr:MAG TPA: hypothetical protein [Caudoviricetes sp.]